MISIGKFSRVLNSEGVLLFKPFLRDSAFLLEESSLFHSVLGTEFKIQSIKKSAKGFRIKFKEVSSQKEGAFFLNEIFSLPKERVEGKSLDLVIGKKVLDEEGKVQGVVEGISETPDYAILVVKNKDNDFFVPFVEKFCKVDNGNIVLLRNHNEN